MPTLNIKSWFLLGCVSTQDRCRGMLLHHNKSLKIADCGFVEIIDSASSFSQKSADRIFVNHKDIEGLAPSNVDFFTTGLLDPIISLKKAIHSWIASSNGNVILDVSTFPERFCFPLIRWLIESPDVKNLVITYMLPEKYTNEDLGYDSQEWGQLPTFVHGTNLNSQQVENVIVGVGFLPYSLPDWLKKTYEAPSFKISLLMPFPAAPANVNRAWEFVRRIEKDLSLRDDRQIIRISAHDVCSVFQRIDTITKCGESPAVFAPYGPKAQSVAMCLHALKHPAEVYFTQPTYYHPEYSTGIALKDGLPMGYSYLIRLDGTDFY